MKLREKYNNVIICKSEVIVAFGFSFSYGFVPALGTKKSKGNSLDLMIERVFLLWGAEEYLFVLFLF